MAIGTIRGLRTTLIGSPNPTAAIESLARSALDKANGNASRNSCLWRNEEWTMAEAARIAATLLDADNVRPALWGIPISVKDCFDLAGSPTSCGTEFYRDLHGVAEQDSWLVERLRASGAVITGKTHLHPLAYGITGENAEFGDCVQPGDPTSLTGGSSSGAAASILEGSAMAAIGTDTGGSVRVPAALCGLAGYRASISVEGSRGDWRGGAHLAQSFDTFGWLFRHLEDAPLLGSIYGPTDATGLKLATTFAAIDESFLHDCEPGIVATFRNSQAELEALGLTKTTVAIDWWSDSLEIFAAIQASEAARIHAGHFAQFEPSIRQRLEWGASLSDSEIVALRQRHATFRDRMDALIAQYALLVLPAAPVARLPAGADHSQTRTRLLRYTTPISLSGMPAVTLPYIANGRPCGGTQLVAAREDDARLLAVAAEIGIRRRSMAASSNTP